jgi:cytosine deaminase
LAADRLLVRRARIEGRDGLHDVAIAGEEITEVARDLEDRHTDVELDAAGRLLAPAFVEPHIHLDKTGVLPTLPPERGGSLLESIELMRETKRRASVEDIRSRAGWLIERMVTAGTTTIRTHVDLDGLSELRTLEGVDLARRDHAGLCEIEIVAFPQLGLEREPAAKELMREAMRHGAEVVGGIPSFEQDHDAAERHIEFCMELAAEHDADVDMHVDETDDPYWHSLELLIDATERHGYGGRVTAAHCCSMAAWDDDYAARIIARAADVGVNVITNPATNLVVQGREDHEPRRRGITRVKELLEGGVTVAAGQDNLHDGFYPLGAGDQMLIAWLLVHAAQLTTARELEAAMASVGSAAAAVLRIPGYAIEPGGRGDVMVLEAESAEEALRLQAPRRWVVHRGRLVAETRREQELHRDCGPSGAGDRDRPGES